MDRSIVAVLATVMFGVTTAAAAGDPPKLVWLKAKCAVCHGEDGAGNTPEGKKRAVPDLRSDAVQKKTDAELAAAINEGHKKMPSFRVQLNADQMKALIIYMRSLAPAKKE